MGWFLFAVYVIGWMIGLYGMFQKAGIPAWKALVPFYNTWCMVEKMELKRVWFFLQFIPIAGFFFTIWITIKFVEHFGRFSLVHHGLTVLVPFLYLPYLGFSKDERYAGKIVYDNYEKSTAREWIDAAVFAIVAATLIRTFIFEAYTIPTPSMEKTLLVNDFLFVSKFSYGARVPQTPLSIPFMHNTVLGGSAKSYSELIQLPYRRWFAKDVTRNDVVVFNFPVNDTFINTPEFGSQRTYYQAVQDMGYERVWSEYGDKIETRPVDKRENFIKRCVAVGGDTIEIINGVVHINGAVNPIPPQAQRYYQLNVPPNSLVDADFLSNIGIKVRESQGDLMQLQQDTYLINITTEEKRTFNFLQAMY